MKRSKIFLGVTTVALSIAGVAEVKRISIPVTRFYLTFNGTACHSTQAVCLQNSGDLTCFGAYTDGIGNILIGALFTQGGSANIVVPAAKCKTKVVWDGHQ
ncbi:MAG: hypothetical protein J0H74_22415 [Chitinophagaceae bacterium]|nr:hypothetical protein [Chitinophagaceae bacterium]